MISAHEEAELETNGKIDYRKIKKAVFSYSDYNKLIIFDEFEKLAENSEIPRRVYDTIRSYSNCGLKFNYLTVSRKSISELEVIYKNITGSPFTTIMTLFNLQGFNNEHCRLLLQNGFKVESSVDLKDLDELIAYAGNSPFYLNRIGAISNKYENIKENMQKIKTEFYQICEAMFSSLMDEYFLERHKKIFSDIIYSGHIPNNIIKGSYWNRISFMRKTKK